MNHWPLIVLQIWELWLSNILEGKGIVVDSSLPFVIAMNYVLESVELSNRTRFIQYTGDDTHDDQNCQANIQE